MGLDIRQQDGCVIINVKVVPHSSRTAVVGLLGGMLKVKVAAAPEKGRANRCLTDYLTELVGVGKEDVELISSQSNPVKTIRFRGVSEKTILDKLGKWIDKTATGKGQK